MKIYAVRFFRTLQMTVEVEARNSSAAEIAAKEKLLTRNEWEEIDTEVVDVDELDSDEDSDESSDE